MEALIVSSGVNKKECIIIMELVRLNKLMFCVEFDKGKENGQSDVV